MNQSDELTDVTMSADEAKELIHLLARIGSQLEQSVTYVRDHDEEARSEEYCKTIGKLMGDIFKDAMVPLYKRFPELRPNYLGGPYQIPESAYLPKFYTSPGDLRR